MTPTKSEGWLCKSAVTRALAFYPNVPYEYYHFPCESRRKKLGKGSALYQALSEGFLCKFSQPTCVIKQSRGEGRWACRVCAGRPAQLGSLALGKPLYLHLAPGQAEAIAPPLCASSVPSVHTFPLGCGLLCLGNSLAATTPLHPRSRDPSESPASGQPSVMLSK